MSVENFSMQNVVRNTSFSIFAGQVTGIFGLVGSGRTETAKIISGVLKRELFHGGDVKLDGKSVRYRVPSQAIRDGIVYVTEGRKIEGFVETMSIAENIYNGSLAGDAKSGNIISFSQMKALAEEWTGMLKVRALGSDARMVELSGGNQQRSSLPKRWCRSPGSSSPTS